MAKKAILDVLESTIGKYVKNLDSESLNVAVWNGQIELHSLELDTGAVNAELDRQAAEAPNLAMPFRVAGGHFESLQIDVPWARITSRSVVFRAKGLNIILEPHARTGAAAAVDPSKYMSDAKLLEQLKEDRLKSLKLYDDYRKQANALKQLADIDRSEGASSNAQNSSGTFGARLVRRIIENLQVEIEHVHVSFRNHDCAAGVVIDSLSLVTTDQAGKHTFVDRTTSRDSFLNKALSIHGFGIYLDERASAYYSKQGAGIDDLHAFILQPLSFEARLRQSDDIRCIDFPKYLLNSELSSLSIKLLRSQLEHVHKLSKSLASMKSGPQPIFPEYRPLLSATTAPRKWWYYAFRCVRRMKGRRMWVEFFLAYQKRKRYIVLFKRRQHALECNWIQPLASEELSELEEIEEDRAISIDGLMAWRSIADAQVELEKFKHGEIQQQKKKQTGYLTSLFGSKDQTSGNEEDDPPIALAVEEMKELESISMEQSDAFELSKDSWLCDVSFVLGAFQIDLLNGVRPMATLSMGTVNSSFNANADGSFTFDFALSSLGLQDLVTQDSLFPMALRNLKGTDDKTMKLRYAKSKTGDQSVSLSMVAIEMVASPLLVRETVKFFTLSTKDQSFRNPQNPILRQSLSGSVDLFFDADTGGASIASLPAALTEASPTFSDQLSLALAEAWKVKMKEKSAWRVDCDIQAPVLIVPESCSHYESSVLVFDLGHVDLAYGSKGEASEEVKEWADGQNVKESSLDAGRMTLTSLSFSVGKAKDILGESGIGNTKPIIEPVSATLNCGILTVANEPSARLCFVGSFPSLSLRGSPDQVAGVLTVVSAWTQLATKLGLDVSKEEDQVDSGTLLLGGDGDDDSISLPMIPSADSYVSAAPDADGMKFHLAISLERLSLYFGRRQGDGVEAHLVSASGSVSQMMDGSLQSRLSMGWFWILDMLESKTPRHQRLVVHSTLPRTAEELALEGKYDIFKDIEAHLATEKEGGSLADVRYCQPGGQSSASDPFESAEPFNEETHDGPLLQASFGSLHLHWNPRAIKTLVSYMEEISDSVSDNKLRSGLVTPQSPVSIESASRQSLFNASATAPATTTERSSTLLIKATMRKLEVLLNSALDDLPLYRFTMVETSVDMISMESNSRMDLGVGDLRMTTPLSSANESYQTMLGLAPSESSSLLSVQYYTGERAIRGISILDETAQNLEAYANIVISPMRFIYLQAPVLTLVDYVMDGILGTLAAHAAASVANVALDIAASGNEGNKIFEIKAVGFDLVIPESAKSESFLSLQAGDLRLKYTALPDPGGGTAVLSLGEVLLKDDSNNALVEDPLHASIDVKLNPEGIGSKDDQAMVVNVRISRASFLLSKNHYSQIMMTLDGNIGQENNFLRTSLDREWRGAVEDEAAGQFVEALQTMTHAGVATVVKETRMFISFVIDAISLEAFRSGRDDSLAKIEGNRMVAEMNFYADQEKSVMKVSLHNLTWSDKRSQSSGRQFTHLFQRSSIETDTEDVFDVLYEKNSGSGSTNIEMKIGSPRVILIPDAISDLLDFVSVPVSVELDLSEAPMTIAADSEKMGVQVMEGEDSIEATYALATKEFSFGFSASNCQLILVDLGTSISSKSRVTAESIVVQGNVECKYSTTSEIETGIERKSELEVHGVEFEAYSAYGFDLRSPLQILEPTSFSAFYSLSDMEGKKAEIEIRTVTLSDVDMTLSIQNIALFDVIASGLTESLERRESATPSPSTHGPMSSEEAERISNLASALEADGGASIKTEKSFTTTQGSTVDDDMSVSSRPTSLGSSRFHWKIRATLPRVAITVVNDLQGMDEPLLRVGSTNSVFGGEATMGRFLSKLEPLFDAHLNCTLTADYFDSSISIWQPLLSKPWEMTLKTSRGVSKRYRTNRLSTTIDLESFPCYVAFSDQFLASLNGANRMWSTYTNAIDSAVQRATHTADVKTKALAASAARKLITSLPYGVENATGIDIHFSVDEETTSETRRLCRTGQIQYFRFEPPKGNGYGGRRLYGQEITHPKRLELYIEGRTITIDHVDNELGRDQKVHKFDDGLIIVTQLRKEAKSMVLFLGGQVDLINLSNIPFQVSASCHESEKDLGICYGASHRCKVHPSVGGEVIHDSKALGLPIDMLRNFEEGGVKPQISLSPNFPGHKSLSKLVGDIIIPASHELLALIETGTSSLVVDTTCSAERTDTSSESLPDPFMVLVRIQMRVVDGKHPFVTVTLEPRATLKNALPVRVTVKTPMPHTFTHHSGTDTDSVDQGGYEILHALAPKEFIEVFTPGPSIAVSVKCADSPIGGTDTDWMKGSWIDLPMVREFRLPEPIKCQFPFVGGEEVTSLDGGVTFFVVEDGEDISEATFEHTVRPKAVARQSSRSLGLNEEIEVGPITSDAMRSYLFTACNFGVDHTRSVLFQHLVPSSTGRRPSSLRSSFNSSMKSSPMRQSQAMVALPPTSSFLAQKGGLRTSILPLSSSVMRILLLTMEGESGFRRSKPIRIEDISICEGGIESSAIQWEDGSQNSHFIYRTLLDSYQSEIHVIPEFIVYNASKTHRVIVRQIGAEQLCEPGTMVPVAAHPKMGLVFTLDYTDAGGRAGPLRVDGLKHQIAMVKSIEGYPLGSVAVQTVIGGRDSRLVVKLGEIKFGDIAENDIGAIRSILERDLVRVRFRWSELNLTLCESRSPDAPSDKLPTSPLVKFAGRVGMKRPTQSEPEDAVPAVETRQPIVTLALRQFTVDWQRVFNDDKAGKRNPNQIVAPERSQLSVIIHNIEILDKTPNTLDPVVYHSTHPKISFFDLCVRSRGSLDADLVKIDLVDLNLAHFNGVSDKIEIRTSETFVWKLLDVANRIMEEATQIAGVDISLEWDEQEGDYRVIVSEGHTTDRDDGTTYTAPPSDMLIDIAKARVSPFSVVVSFRRQPHASRYKLVRDIKGAKLMNYFTTRLKFTLEKAELRFARYNGTNIRGPPSRLFEILSAVYVSRLKLKVVTILSAANFQDWRFLAARDEGDDEFVEGDVLRVTGNLAGNTANFLAKTVGEGLGGGLSSVTKSIGLGIENASDKVGARAVGAGVNSVVSGLGDGVGNTVAGVGTGAGKILKGAGKGVGQIFGGVTGAVLIAGKGIGKGVSTGDGKAVVSGFAEGAASVGSGVGQGVESAVMGTADGVLSVGKGLFSGAKSIGKGFGGAFKKSPRK